MDNTVDVTPRLDPPAAMTPVDFVVDNLVVQVTVARFGNGVKVAEETVSARLLYPFSALRGDNLDALCTQAEAQVRAAWEGQQGGA